MSLRREDGVSSLCQKALHIVTELCFAGQVEWERCAGIFPPERGGQGGASSTGESRERGPSLRGVRAPGVPRGHLWLEQLWSGARGSRRAARAHLVVAAKFRGGPLSCWAGTPQLAFAFCRMAPGPGEVGAARLIRTKDGTRGVGAPRLPFAPDPSRVRVWRGAWWRGGSCAD